MQAVPGQAPAAMDLALVPGLAFDRAGRRLGRGGGHYDRLLARAPLRAAFKIGLAFAWQLQPRVPAARHDVPMDLVATEKELIGQAVSRRLPSSSNTRYLSS